MKLESKGPGMDLLQAKLDVRDVLVVIHCPRL
jgi:hypothetical protein